MAIALTEGKAIRISGGHYTITLYKFKCLEYEIMYNLIMTKTDQFDLIVAQRKSYVVKKLVFEKIGAEEATQILILNSFIILNYYC